MPFVCEVTAPAAVPVNVQFANGKTVIVPGGQRGEFSLTGDEIGRVEAEIDAARRRAKREGAYDHEVLGGGLKVKSKDYGKVPKGSKKEKLLRDGHALPDSAELAGGPEDPAEKERKARRAAEKRADELQARLEALEGKGRSK